ncbi:threonine synthase, partial [Campylobacter coli]
MKFKCSKCGALAPLESTKYRCECGGLYDLDFTPPKFST